MQREKETSRKKCQAKGRRQEKDAKTSGERDFKEMACREKQMSGQRHAERKRDFKNKMPREADFKKKNAKGKK